MGEHNSELIRHITQPPPRTVSVPSYKPVTKALPGSLETETNFPESLPLARPFLHLPVLKENF